MWHTRVVLIFMAWMSCQNTSYGVDDSPLKPTKLDPKDRFSLIGIIAEGDKKGIAVLRDLSTGKTLTLRVGESLPDLPDVLLASVSRRYAVLTGQGRKIVVTSQGTSPGQKSDLANELPTQTGEPVEVGSGGPGLFEIWYQNRKNRVFEDVADQVPTAQRQEHQASDDQDDDENAEGTAGSWDPAPTTKQTEYNRALKILIDKHLSGAD